MDLLQAAVPPKDENHSCGYLEPLEDPHLLASWWLTVMWRSWLLSWNGIKQCFFLSGFTYQNTVPDLI